MRSGGILARTDVLVVEQPDATALAQKSRVYQADVTCALDDGGSFLPGLAGVCRERSVDYVVVGDFEWSGEPDCEQAAIRHLDIGGSVVEWAALAPACWADEREG